MCKLQILRFFKVPRMRGARTNTAGCPDSAGLRVRILVAFSSRRDPFASLWFQVLRAFAVCVPFSIFRVITQRVFTTVWELPPYCTCLNSLNCWHALFFFFAATLTRSLRNFSSYSVNPWPKTRSQYPATNADIASSTPSAAEN